MRPRRLELTAFGPFAGTEAVDFDALAGAGLFLITGLTGAGKTSLLDAISYAVYGKVPGDRRPERLRSDHAPAGVETEVALEFSHAGEDWRVTRKPPHERPRRRGFGTTLQKPTATLSRRIGDRWEPLCTGVEEVGGHVVGLLGLDAEQFAQVVVLPQGEVQRALRADAREREGLLSSLFATGRFAAVADRLADRAKDLTEQVTRHQDQLDGQRSEAALRWREVAKELDELDDLAEPPASIAELEALAARATEAAGTVAAVKEAARAAAGEAAARLREGERLAHLQARRCRAQQRLDSLRSQAEAIAETAGRVEQARAAAPAAALIEEAECAALALRVAEQDRRRALAALPQPFDPDATLQQLRAQRARVAAAIPRAAAALVARGKAVEAEKDAAAFDEVAQRCARSAADDAREAARTEEMLTHARQAAAILPTAAAEADRLRDAAAAASNLGARQEAYVAARERVLEAGEAAQAARGAHQDLVRRSLEGMAGQLAEQLRAGEDCPVCGATEHPRPASWGDPVTSLQIEAADGEAARLTADAETARIQRDDALHELERTRAAAGDAADDPAGFAVAAAEAMAAVDVQRALAQQAQQLADDLSDLRQRHESARVEMERARELATDARTRAAAAIARAEADECAVADIVGAGVDPGAVGAQLADAEHLTEAAGRAVTAHDRARREADAAQERALTTVRGQGFADLEQAQAALLDDAEATALRAQVEEHMAALGQAEATLAEPEIAALGTEPRADVPALETAADAALRAAESAVERYTTVTRAAAELRTLARTCADAERQLAPLQRDAARVRHLAEVCRGTGNTRRMSLERFVLAAALEEVTARASVRLAAMTEGRFTLRHSDERARNNKASGLSILVRDAFTGTERDVGTLSGGETFQASLALALGIADAVSSRGALPLDTLFVDEGFGSLDPEALEQAMTELDRLREGGRLVGVISHVSALRERIPAGLHVERARAGSRVVQLG